MPPKRHGHPGKEPKSSSVDNANVGEGNGLRAMPDMMTAMFERQMQQQARLMDTLLARMPVASEQSPPMTQPANKSLFKQFKWPSKLCGFTRPDVG